MISSAQIRAARGMLNWSMDDLAEASGLSKQSIFKIEKGVSQARTDTLEQLVRTFLEQGLVFLPDDGIKRQASDIQVYRGKQAFIQWYDDIYNAVKDGGHIGISGCREADFSRWFSPEEDAVHSDRMNAIADKIICQVILQDGDFNFTYSGYATYKWIAKELWSPHPLYLYGSKLAMIAFHDDGPVVTVINSPEAAYSFRKFFTATWDSACKPVPNKRKAEA